MIVFNSYGSLQVQPNTEIGLIGCSPENFGFARCDLVCELVFFEILSKCSSVTSGQVTNQQAGNHNCYSFWVVLIFIFRVQEGVDFTKIFLIYYFFNSGKCFGVIAFTCNFLVKYPRWWPSKTSFWIVHLQFRWLPKILNKNERNQKNRKYQEQAFHSLSLISRLKTFMILALGNLHKLLTASAGNPAMFQLYGGGHEPNTR